MLILQGEKASHTKELGTGYNGDKDCSAGDFELCTNSGSSIYSSIHAQDSHPSREDTPQHLAIGYMREMSPWVQTTDLPSGLLRTAACLHL